jgi:hypothetical protein
MHVAAKHGHLAVVGALLDRGADHFAIDKRQFRAIDWAALRGHAPLLRMMEARTCPFAWELRLHVDGVFGARWRDVWVAVHRARPWDNPAMPRAAVIACVYEGREKTFPLYRLGQPALAAPPSGALDDDADAGRAPAAPGEVTFELASASAAKRGGMPRSRALLCRAPEPVFRWLAAVLADEFGGGRGPAYDDNGAVWAPAEARSVEARMSTDALCGERGMAAQLRALPRAVTPAQAHALAAARRAPKGASKDHGFHSWQPPGPLPGTGGGGAGGASRPTLAVGSGSGRSSPVGRRPTQATIAMPGAGVGAIAPPPGVGAPVAGVPPGTSPAELAQQAALLEHFSRERDRRQSAGAVLAGGGGVVMAPAVDLNEVPDPYAGAYGARVATGGGMAAQPPPSSLSRRQAPSGGRPQSPPGVAGLRTSSAPGAHAARAMLGSTPQQGSQRRGFSAQVAAGGAGVPPAARAPVQSAPLAAVMPLGGPYVPDVDALSFDAEPPADYLCPITMDVMVDPVVAGDGHTYSRGGISRWLRDHRTSPKTNEVLPDGRLVPNHLLRGQILTWIDAHRTDRVRVPPAAAQQSQSRGSSDDEAAEVEVESDPTPQRQPSSSAAAEMLLADVLPTTAAILGRRHTLGVDAAPSAPPEEEPLPVPRHRLHQQPPPQQQQQQHSVTVAMPPPVAAAAPPPIATAAAGSRPNSSEELDALAAVAAMSAWPSAPPLPRRASSVASGSAAAAAAVGSSGSVPFSAAAVPASASASAASRGSPTSASAVVAPSRLSSSLGASAASVAATDDAAADPSSAGEPTSPIAAAAVVESPPLSARGPLVAAPPNYTRAPSFAVSTSAATAATVVANPFSAAPPGGAAPPTVVVVPSTAAAASDDDDLLVFPAVPTHVPSVRAVAAAAAPASPGGGLPTGSETGPRRSSPGGAMPA